LDYICGVVIMDTTPKYIKMCEKSPLREKHTYRRGDLLYDPVSKFFVIYLRYEKPPYSQGIHKFDNGENRFGKRNIPYHYIPLYRQDQLQEMAKESNEPAIIQLHFFKAWVYNQHEDYIQVLSSMEQLWLAYVMHELYDKVWDDKKEEWL